MTKRSILIWFFAATLDWCSVFSLFFFSSKAFEGSISFTLCVTVREKREAMAVGVAVERGSWEYNGRMTSFVVLSCMMAAMGGVIFGYDNGISGLVISLSPITSLFICFILFLKRRARLDVFLFLKLCIFFSLLKTVPKHGYRFLRIEFCKSLLIVIGKKN